MKLLAEYVSRLPHQLIWLWPLLDDTRFKPSWSVGDFALGDLFEHREAIAAENVFVDQSG